MTAGWVSLWPQWPVSLNNGVCECQWQQEECVHSDQYHEILECVTINDSWMSFTVTTVTSIMKYWSVSVWVSVSAGGASLCPHWSVSWNIRVCKCQWQQEECHCVHSDPDHRILECVSVSISWGSDQYHEILEFQCVHVSISLMSFTVTTLKVITKYFNVCECQYQLEEGHLDHSDQYPKHWSVCVNFSWRSVTVTTVTSIMKYWYV